MIELATAAEVIAALGGPKKVAELLGVSEPWVSNCRTSGQFPGKHRRAICAALPKDTVAAERLFHMRRVQR